MAKQAGIDPKRFRSALRKNFHWHQRYARWTVQIGSKEHDCMKRVLDRILS